MQHIRTLSGFMFYGPAFRFSLLSLNFPITRQTCRNTLCLMHFCTLSRCCCHCRLVFSGFHMGCTRCGAVSTEKLVRVNLQLLQGLHSSGCMPNNAAVSVISIPSSQQ